MFDSQSKRMRTALVRRTSALALVTFTSGALLAACAVENATDATQKKAEASATAPAPVLTGKIDDMYLVPLAGNIHPATESAQDLGPLAPDTRIEHMQLVLQRSPTQEKELEELIERLHDSTSADFHQWLTPVTFASRFGVNAEDVATVSRWLESHGFTIDSVPVSRMFVEFTGNAGQVQEAFHTEMHALNVGGVRHIANMGEPRIPVALSPVVVGVHALHDFMPHPLHHDLGAVKKDSAGRWSAPGTPDLTVNDGTSGTFHAVAPTDFATIYNLNPLFAAGYAGAGQTIAVIEATNILNASDVASFRTTFGLSNYAGTFSQVQPEGKTTCKNPGVNAAESEAALDAEWAGATAPDATIELASCASTSTVFGGLIAMENLVNGANPPPILSVSYGECEAENGNTANASYVSTFEQAAAEGISVFVSAGDEGAASCDANRPYATHGIAVSGFASTPYNVAVGGTDFMDDYNSLSKGPPLSKYWSATNGPAFGSALSYIPEIPWNDSCAGKLLSGAYGYAESYGASGFCASTMARDNFLSTAAGSGGPSTFSAQPSWQTGVIGLPTSQGGRRYLPDVSLFAANGVWGHFYVYCMSDEAEGGVACNYASSTEILHQAAGGTSFAAPALAGIQALVNQRNGGSQGNPNVNYYKLASQEFGPTGSKTCNSSSGAPTSPEMPASNCIFNDVTTGDIDIPCAGAIDCYGYGTAGGKTDYGALSPLSSTFNSAYRAGTGWDYATGLGSVNAYNLVMNWHPVETHISSGSDG